MTIGLFFRNLTDSIIRTARDTANWLISNDVKVNATPEICNLLDIEMSDSFPMECDVVLSLGGDGTLLRAVRQSAPLDIPVLGINLGNLGYLTEVEESEIYNSLSKLLDREYTLESREMLNAVVIREGNEVSSTHSLNDVYIYRDVDSRLVEAQLYIDSQPVGITRSDGLIVCTATGSTAYALSSGGAILDHDCSNFEIVTICPHKISHRPIIIPSSKKVTIKFLSPSGRFSFFADGDVIDMVKEHDRINITRSKHTARLIRMSNKNFFNVLKTKFDWSR
jgi:NAD+ kinase